MSSESTRRLRGPGMDVTFISNIKVDGGNFWCIIILGRQLSWYTVVRNLGKSHAERKLLDSPNPNRRQPSYFLFVRFFDSVD